jgi:hypothetical protein
MYLGGTWLTAERRVRPPIDRHHHMTPTTEQCALVNRRAASQHDLITREQLRTAGVSDRQVHQWQQTGYLRRVERSVYLIAGGKMTWTTRLLSVCLSAEGIASHRSAAVLHGLEGVRPGRPEITIPAGRSFRRPTVRVHESGDLALVRPVLRDGITTTPVARTVLDLGAVAPSLVENAARDAVGQRLTIWPDLFATLISHSRKGRSGCGPLRAVLDEHYGDETESNLERRFLRFVRLAGLPEPVQQFEAYDADGFIMRLDFAYPDLFFAIELDSVAYHLTNQAFELDPIKRNRLEVAGWQLLVVTSQQLRRRPTTIYEQLAESIRTRSAFFRQLCTPQVHQ